MIATNKYLNLDESFFVDVLGYSEEEISEMSDEYLKELVEQNKEDYENWVKPYGVK